MIHELKIRKEYLVPIILEQKTFEVRRNDRDFRVGDYLLLKEIDLNNNPTGNYQIVKVTYILNHQEFCKEGYIIMGIKLDKFYGKSEIQYIDLKPYERVHPAADL